MRSARLALAGAVASALLLGQPAPAVLAAQPVPTPDVTLPATIDSPSFYEPQTVCDPTARPGSTALKDLLVKTYGPATVYIPRACTSSTSEHFDGRAVDWMHSVRVSSEKAEVDAFLAWLLADGRDGTPKEMARRLGVMYVIWNNRMIRTYDERNRPGWTEYSGCTASSRSAASYDTTCHRNHVHISLSWDGAAKLTSWWTGTAMTLPSCAATSTSAAPGAGRAYLVPSGSEVPGLVAVDPVSVLDTAGGTGAGLTRGCRVLAGRSLHASSPPAVPDSAVAVAVRLTVRSNAPSKLSVWSSGGARPTGQVPLGIGTTTTATVVVPLSSRGTFAVSPSLGSAAVSASVVGYLTSASAGPAPAPAPVLTAPHRPRSVKATAGHRRVTTRWKAPTGASTSRITGYRVQALTSAKKGAKVAGACKVGPTKRSCTIKRLKKGKKYWMSVSVANAAGRTWAARVKVKVR